MKRFKRWNQWRKNNLNSKWHQLLVLLGLRVSPTFQEMCIMEDVWEELND